VRLSLLLWPFAALWRLIASIVTLTGRFVAVLLGLMLVIVGIVLTVTVVGAVLGVPLMALGMVFVARGLF
jgi:hypothetical protein